jgi:hypothetical protein
MVKRLKSWARTLAKLTLLVFGYLWIGAAYKLAYAQTHDLERFRGKLPISYYQQQFLLDCLLRQTWMFGPDFHEYLGELPSLGALFTSSPQAVLADYCRARERQLSSLPERYPNSIFAEEALEDAHLLSQGASFLSVLSAREQPRTAVAFRQEDGSWRSMGTPDLSHTTDLARRLADEYPDSPQAPQALLRVAEAESDAGNTVQGRDLYLRLLREYPRSKEAEQAANVLFRKASEEGQAEAARGYKQRALQAAEGRAREQFAGRAIPARDTFTILGHRVDLSGVEVQLENLREAQELLAVAGRESGRLQTLPALEQDIKNDLRGTQQRMERVRSELWVEEMFHALKEQTPGPPPRPHEREVSGRVTLEGKPFPGVEVVLVDARAPAAQNLGMLGQVGSLGPHAVSDSRGDYRITGVRSGAYRMVALYPVQPSGAGGAPVVPEDPVGAQPPAAIPVAGKPVTASPLPFKKALRTRTFGELKPVGKALALEWDPWPGAVAYQAEVVAPEGMSGAFDQRVPREQRDAFRKHAQLWQSRPVKALRVECPLLPLAPDNPAFAQAAQYEYAVTALDAAGKPLARSASVLSRFNLSPEARAALMELKPPIRGRPRGFGRGRRPRRNGQ